MLCACKSSKASRHLCSWARLVLLSLSILSSASCQRSLVLTRSTSLRSKPKMTNSTGSLFKLRSLAQVSLQTGAISAPIRSQILILMPILAIRNSFTTTKRFALDSIWPISMERTSLTTDSLSSLSSMARIWSTCHLSSVALMAFLTVSEPAQVCVTVSKCAALTLNKKCGISIVWSVFWWTSKSSVTGILASRAIQLI